MQFQNFTPFPAMAFGSVAPGNRRFRTVVLRQSFELRNGVLTLAKDQTPLATSDIYYGEPNESSVKAESDLAPYKPRCDVIVCADAHVPGGRAVSCFDVSATLVAANGKSLLNRRVRVYGSREFVRKGNGWVLNDPEPFVTLPMRYEHALGGQCSIKHDDDSMQHAACQSNPLGTGFMTQWYIDAVRPDRVPAPRIEAPEASITSEHWNAWLANPDESLPPPVGLGVMGRAWAPRLRRAGTYDERWLESQHPGLPDDFDFAYWNGAHPALQTAYLKGDETLVLTNLVPVDHPQARVNANGDTELTLRLPGHLPMGWLYMNGDLTDAALNLDTLHVDLTQAVPQVVLVWRAAVSHEAERFEARFISNQEKIQMTGRPHE
ncbi:DUF2169 domain-containing protein [Caballeronia sp. LZ029]|uniref:DUF2169 family type VI secretion system accessory protein n=1 Tax=Caballeronia sp. LZ029 TaxID=3038564 RepID=UPI0028595EBA|nr:DUF2169 domain-containing protein [Caballeronia sp. LZ029]MDR5745431.1 DUF2169 domain-containing protein [Caballeronia sp. LZ029]